MVYFNMSILLGVIVMKNNHRLKPEPAPSNLHHPCCKVLVRSLFFHFRTHRVAAGDNVPMC